MKKLILLSLVLSFFISCTTSNDSKKIQDFSEPALRISIKQELLKDACLSCLCIVGNYTINNIKYIAFIDYHPGRIYVFNTSTNLFDFSFHIPKNCYLASVVKMLNPDSILYFNNEKGMLTVCDTHNIKHEYYPKNFYPDSNITFTYFHNVLRQVNNKLVFDIAVHYNNNTKKDYYEKTNSTPILGLFEFTNGNLIHESIPLYNQVKASDEAEIPDNHIVFTTNQKKNTILFSHKCSNNIYSYDLETKTVKENVPKNTNLVIEPIFYSQTKKTNETGDPYTNAVNKQNTCSDIIYNEKSNFVYRIVNVNEKEGRIRYLQVLNDDFEVILETALPKEFIEMAEYEGNLLIHTIDRKKREIVYEKANINN